MPRGNPAFQIIDQDGVQGIDIGGSLRARSVSVTTELGGGGGGLYPEANNTTSGDTVKLSNGGFTNTDRTSAILEAAGGAFLGGGSVPHYLAQLVAEVDYPTAQLVARTWFGLDLGVPPDIPAEQIEHERTILNEDGLSSFFPRPIINVDGPNPGVLNWGFVGPPTVFTSDAQLWLWSVSGYVPSPRQAFCDLRMDGGIVGNTQMFFNNAGVHSPLPMGMAVTTFGKGETHTPSLTAAAGLTADLNDRWSLVLWG